VHSDTEKCEGEEEPGDILGYDSEEKRHFVYGVSTLLGVGESDFLSGTIRNVTGYRGAFGYLSPHHIH
jgi:hypothetical protein